MREDRLIVVLGLALIAGCSTESLYRHPYSIDTTPAFPSDPVDASQSRTHLSELLEKLAKSPETLENKRLAFPTSLGQDGQLAVYDLDKEDVYLYPGAGTGIKQIGEIASDSFLFRQDFTLRVYNGQLEESHVLFDPRQVGGFAFYPYPDLLGSLYCLGSDSQFQAEEGLGQLFRFPVPTPVGTVSFADVLSTRYPTPKAISVTKVNALAANHGWIQSFFVNASSEVLYFTTGDGGLYLYTPQAPAVQEVRTNREVGHGQAAFVTGDYLLGRRIAWEDRELKQVFMLDRATGLIETLQDSLPPLDGKAIADRIPFFYLADPFHLYLVTHFKDGSYRLSSRDLRSGETTALTLLNVFLAGSP